MLHGELGELAARGLRVLAVASPRAWSGHLAARRDGGRVGPRRLLGFVALEDPPRRRCRGAVAACRRGRHPRGHGDGRPSGHRARDRPRGRAGRPGRAGSSTAPRLPADEQVLGALVDHDGAVVARVAPEDKLRIARAPAAPGARRGDDRRRRQRRPGAPGRGHRDRDGSLRHRRRPGGGRPRAARRRLRDDRRRHRAGPRHVLEHPPLPHVPPHRQRRGADAVRRLGALGREVPAGARRAAGAGARHRHRPAARARAGRRAAGRLRARGPAAPVATCSTAASLGRVFVVLGPTEAVVEMAAFLATFVAAGWRPGDTFPTGPLLDGVRRRVHRRGARPVRQRVRLPQHRRTGPALGWSSNRLLLGAVAVEALALVAFLCLPPLADLLGTGRRRRWDGSSRRSRCRRCSARTPWTSCADRPGRRQPPVPLGLSAPVARQAVDEIAHLLAAQLRIRVQPEPGVVARRHRAFRDRLRGVAHPLAVMRRPLREVQLGASLVHVALDPPRDRGDLLEPEQARLVAVAVEAGDLGEPARAGAVPGSARRGPRGSRPDRGPAASGRRRRRPRAGATRPNASSSRGLRCAVDPGDRKGGPTPCLPGRGRIVCTDRHRQATIGIWVSDVGGRLHVGR